MLSLQNVPKEKHTRGRNTHHSSSAVRDEISVGSSTTGLQDKVL